MTEDGRTFASWRVDKQSGVPLYLQVKELLRRHVAGSSAVDEKLPSVHEVAAALGITFETVRKAFKALASEGVISMGRGRRSVPSPPAAVRSADLAARTRNFLSTELLSRLDLPAARALVDQAFRELVRDPAVFFTECNDLQVGQLSLDLSRHLGVDVQGVLLASLKPEIDRALQHSPLCLVLTTGFHLVEVRSSLEGLAVEIECLVTSMSPQMRRKLQDFGPDARFGILCPNRQSTSFYRDVIRTELGLAAEIPCAVFPDGAPLISSCDVLLCAAPVYDRVRRVAPPRVHVLNVFDRLDPASLLAIRETLRTLRRFAGQPAPSLPALPH